MSIDIIRLAKELANKQSARIPALSGKQLGDLLFCLERLHGYSL